MAPAFLLHESRAWRTWLKAGRRIAAFETTSRMLQGMLPPQDTSSFMSAPMPSGWVLRGQRWGLWWGSREVAFVQPDASGIRVVLACRKLWQIKEVRAASVAQGKRYAERWCAARVLPDLPLRQAVERITASDEPVQPVRVRTLIERQQERRLAVALRPPFVP